MSGCPPAGAPRDVRVPHAASCARCRRDLVADEPTRLFALLAETPLPDDALERLSASVAELPARRGPRGLGWSVAASLLLAALMAGIAPDGGEDRTPSRVVDARPASAPAGTAGFQLVRSPGEAQVVDLSVGETQIVMIFDKELGL